LRSAVTFVATGLAALGGLSYVVKGFIWLLNAIGLFQTGMDVLANRSALVKWFITITQALPLGIFMLGVFVLACIRFGSPLSWITWLWTTKLERLRAVLGRGQDFEIMFELPERSKPGFYQCVAWNDESIKRVKALVDAGTIQHTDFVRFTERWNEAGCRNAEQRLADYGRLDNVDDVGRTTYRYIFGRLRRLQELIDKIDGKAPERARLIVSYYPSSQGCMTEYQYGGRGEPGIMVRLQVEPGSAANVSGCSGVLQSLQKSGKMMFFGGNLPMCFAPADQPDTRNKTIAYGLPEHLEIIWIPKEGDALIKAEMPFAPSYQGCKKLDKQSHYVLTVAVSAPEVPATRIEFHAFPGDNGWRFHTKQLS